MSYLSKLLYGFGCLQIGPLYIFHHKNCLFNKQKPDKYFDCGHLDFALCGFHIDNLSIRQFVSYQNDFINFIKLNKQKTQGSKD